MLDKLECNGTVASTLSLGSTLPIETDAVVADICVALTIQTTWLFFSAFDLPILARPTF